MSLSKPASDAIEALTSSQVDFLKALPKAELHAHLNGSIPLPVLQQLAKEYAPPDADSDPAILAIQPTVEKLQNGVVLNEIHDFFPMFPAIYVLTSTKETLARAAEAVLAEFLGLKDGEEYPQATYLELRSTPRKTIAMTRLEYVETVLDEVEKYRPDQAALIVSIDRRMTKETADECIEAAVTLKKRGRRVVGIDLCGDPTVSSSRTDASGLCLPLPRPAIWNSSRVTLRPPKLRDWVSHSTSPRCISVLFPTGWSVLTMSQTAENTPEDTSTLLSFKPDRLGHATFLNDEAQGLVIREKIAIEICLTSNFL
jgi:adenosine deaminase